MYLYKKYKVCLNDATFNMIFVKSQPRVPPPRARERKNSCEGQHRVASISHFFDLACQPWVSKSSSRPQIKQRRWGIACT